jgi:acyl carrier protein
MDIERIIEQHIVDELLLGKRTSVGVNDSLVAGGILDSLTLLELIAFVERRFGITVDEREMSVDNFQTIAHVRRLIDAKLGAGGQR